MLRSILVLALLGACDVGAVVGGSSSAPDAATGGGGGGGNVDASTGGGGGSTASLKVTVTTSPTPNAVYSPNNVVAVWIVSSGGTFVKTIDRWANVRRQYLLAWTQAAGLADSDAVSGASRTSHATPLTITWDLKDKQNTIVADGTYTIRMEVADQNATQQGQNNEGTFTFVKGAQPQTQSGLSNGGFTNVSIDFKP